ncbi:MAG: hypothetical protein ACK4GN_16610 [Runella sp.]
MDLRNTKDNILAKANNGIEYYCPPSKDGGDSNAGKILNSNAALAHSIKINQTNSIGMGFNPFHKNEYPKMNIQK